MNLEHLRRLARPLIAGALTSTLLLWASTTEAGLHPHVLHDLARDRAATGDPPPHPHDSDQIERPTDPGGRPSCAICQASAGRFLPHGGAPLHGRPTAVASHPAGEPERAASLLLIGVGSPRSPPQATLG